MTSNDLKIALKGFTWSIFYFHAPLTVSFDFPFCWRFDQPLFQTLNYSTIQLCWLTNSDVWKFLVNISWHSSLPLNVYPKTSFQIYRRFPFPTVPRVLTNKKWNAFRRSHSSFPISLCKKYKIKNSMSGVKTNLKY